MDVEFAVHVKQAEDGVEVGGESGHLAIGINAEDAVRSGIWRALLMSSGSVAEENCGHPGSNKPSRG